MLTKVTLPSLGRNAVLWFSITPFENPTAWQF
jgi:hypothetical protein